MGPHRATPSRRRATSRWIDIDRKILFGRRDRQGLGHAWRGEGKPGAERKINQSNDPSAFPTAAHGMTPFFQSAAGRFGSLDPETRREGRLRQPGEIICGSPSADVAGGRNSPIVREQEGEQANAFISTNSISAVLTTPFQPGSGATG
jgi:hypothetical protein